MLRGWPPKPMQSIKLEKVEFNHFYWAVDSFTTLLTRWMDNGLVFFVSTVHTEGNYIEQNCGKLRKTVNNKHHVERVWGKNMQVKISIPRIVDDYNYWMSGFDVVDELIAYYYPNLPCRRNYIPLFILHLLMICNNYLWSILTTME